MGERRYHDMSAQAAVPQGAPMRYGMGAPAHPVDAERAAYLQAVQAAQAAWAAQAAAMPQAPPQKKRRRWPKVLLLLLLLLIAAAIACFFLLDCGGSKRSGVAGQLEGKSASEIQSELDRVVEEGMFNISIASSVQMAHGTDEAELRIENVPGNRYLMRVVIIEEATGEKLYETDLIEPNFHIQKDTLDVALDAGVHTCLAVCTAYDPGTEEEIGQAAARMSIQVAS